MYMRTMLYWNVSTVTMSLQLPGTFQGHYCIGNTHWNTMGQHMAAIDTNSHSLKVVQKGQVSMTWNYPLCGIFSCNTRWITKEVITEPSLSPDQGRVSRLCPSNQKRGDRCSSRSCQARLLHFPAPGMHFQVLCYRLHVLRCSALCFPAKEGCSWQLWQKLFSREHRGSTKSQVTSKQLMLWTHALDASNLGSCRVTDKFHDLL